MKCHLILDLLPLYEEGLCSEETKKIVQHHLEDCETCGNFYKDMTIYIQSETIDLEQQSEKVSDKEEDFWYKYYKKLLVRGLVLYLSAYLSAILAGLLIKELFR